MRPAPPVAAPGDRGGGIADIPRLGPPVPTAGGAGRIVFGRVRQIEAKALRKLRHPSRSKKLKDFLD